jgi:hypothetical protein
MFELLKLVLAGVQPEFSLGGRGRVDPAGIKFVFDFKNYVIK